MPRTSNIVCSLYIDTNQICYKNTCFPGICEYLVIRHVVNADAWQFPILLNFLLNYFKQLVFEWVFPYNLENLFFFFLWNLFELFHTFIDMNVSRNDEIEDSLPLRCRLCLWPLILFLIFSCNFLLKSKYVCPAFVLGWFNNFWDRISLISIWVNRIFGSDCSFTSTFKA